MQIDPRLPQVAVGDRLVDPDVVGVRQPVEHHRHVLGLAGDRLDLIVLGAAGGQQYRRRSADQEGDRLSHRSISPICEPLVWAHGTASRSASVNAQNSAIANNDRITTAANARAVSNCGNAWVNT